jgi:hypothetical protein
VWCGSGPVLVFAGVNDLACLIGDDVDGHLHVLTLYAVVCHAGHPLISGPLSLSLSLSLYAYSLSQLQLHPSLRDQFNIYEMARANEPLQLCERYPEAPRLFARLCQV